MTTFPESGHCWTSKASEISGYSSLCWVWQTSKTLHINSFFMVVTIGWLVGINLQLYLILGKYEVTSWFLNLNPYHPWFGNFGNILKTFSEIGVVANTTSLQIWSCKLFDPNRHDAYNAPIQRSLWLQAYAFKRLKNYNKATSFPHSPCSVDMSATFYWKYQGIDNAA